jgi:hypothetical protein
MLRRMERMSLAEDDTPILGASIGIPVQRVAIYYGTLLVLVAAFFLTETNILRSLLRSPCLYNFGLNRPVSAAAGAGILLRFVCSIGFKTRIICGRITEAGYQKVIQGVPYAFTA